jgi:hypothetical protein
MELVPLSPPHAEPDTDANEDEGDAEANTEADTKLHGVVITTRARRLEIGRQDGPFWVDPDRRRHILND